MLLQANPGTLPRPKRHTRIRYDAVIRDRSNLKALHDARENQGALQLGQRRSDADVRSIAKRKIDGAWRVHGRVDETVGEPERTDPDGR